MTIIRNEEVRAGKPIIKGTRITVGDIAERFYKLGRGTQEIASDLDINENDVEEALRYYTNEVLGSKPTAEA